MYEIAISGQRQTAPSNYQKNSVRVLRIRVRSHACSRLWSPQVVESNTSCSVCATEINSFLAAEKSLLLLKYFFTYSTYKLIYAMAKLVDVYRAEKQPSISKKQLPLLIDENLTVRMVTYLFLYI